MPENKINNIVFDLGNILVNVDYRRFTDSMGWDYDIFMRFFDSNFFRKFEVGKHDEKTFFKELNKYIPLKEDDEKRYQVSPGGVVLVTPDMLGQKRHYVR